MDETTGNRAPQFVFFTDTPADGDTAPRFGWRLMAANRRPLGRGVTVTSSLADCRADAERVRVDIDRATTAVSASDARWSWRLSVDGAAVAVSARAYLRRVECLRGLRQFDTAVRRADPDAGVLRAFGPHALRGYGDPR